jgi:hypothetical protein
MNDCLAHHVNAVRGLITGLGKAEFGSRRVSGDTDREMPAEMAFNVGSLVAFASGAPAVHTEHREITRLALAAVGSRDEILWYLPSRAVRDAI